jgi:photosystem II stability/assembly factor-like uncharacterized protein
MKSLVILIAFLFIIFSNTKLQAQWVQFGGPYSGISTCFASNGSSLFGGSDKNGVFHSTNNGTNWIPKNTGLTDSYIHALIFNGNNLFAGTGNGVFLSTNNGSSWTNTEFPHDFFPTCFSVIGSNLFTGSWGGGVFLSTDNGANWIGVNSGLTNHNLWALASSSSNLFAGTDTGVFRSSDNGNSWTFSGLSNMQVSSFTLSPGQSGIVNLFAGTFQSGVFLSTDNGITWTSSNLGLTSAITTLTSCPDGNGGTYLFAGTTTGGRSIASGVFLSTNNGTSWSPVNSGLTYKAITSFAVAGTTLLAGTYGGGVFRSSDYGSNWFVSNGGFPSNISISALSAQGSNLFAVVGSSRILSISTDNGNNWSKSSLVSLTPNPIAALVVIGNNLIAGNDNRTWLSSDNGITWSPSFNGPGYIYSLVANGLDIFAGSHYGLFHSTDYGLNWVSLSDDFWFSWYGVYDIAFKETNIFLVTSSGIQLSTDNGSTWNPVNSDLPVYPFKFGVKLAACGNNLIAGTSNGIYLSSDNGTSWNPINNGLPANTPFPTLLVSGTNIFAATNQYNGENIGSVFCSTNNGADWLDASSGLPHDSVNFGVNSLTLNGTNLLVGTNTKGIWSRPLSELTGVSKEEIKLPKDFILSQNYPNPFNPGTIISYSLPSSSNIKVIVYNSLGQTIKTLESGYKTAGNYSIYFNASNLPSGIYFYKLEAGQFTQTKKMILLK